ncbi:aminotransferase class I/II-fold pyridoxal phosphate-dependent enzyme [Magnetococcus sp. PR-3]|uniref:aminotransferase class I/II-fold pyridoxal phosphate-dependent enzyme n=1 Tax=Magnetococcus sp. PR-3 TaxID=3120355 RepID=UPI002FCE6799
MTSLSQRGHALTTSSPMAPYIHEHFKRLASPWDPNHRPDGYIALSIAENKQIAPSVLTCLDRYRDVPAGVLGYDDTFKAEAFRAHLAHFMGRTFVGNKVDADRLIVLAGAGCVLENLFYTIADPGDGVLVPLPSYAGFWADLETRDNLTIIPVDCSHRDNYDPTPELLDEALAKATIPVRALLFTSPNNPMGRTYSREEVQAVLDWAETKQIHVIFDEIYALSVFGDRAFVSAASLRTDLGKNVHIVWGFSKDFGASGLRCGVLLSHNDEVLHAVSALSYWATCSGHTQYLLSKFVSDHEVIDHIILSMKTGLKQAYQQTTDALNHAKIPYIPANSGIFLICDLRSYLDEPSWEGERRLWHRILDETNVNLTPGEYCHFSEPGFFRFCYMAEPDRAVATAIDRLDHMLNKKKT